MPLGNVVAACHCQALSCYIYIYITIALQLYNFDAQVRMTAQEDDPSASVMLHDVHRDVPLAVAFIQNCLLQLKPVPEKLLIKAGSILSSSLRQVQLAPFLKETLCQTLCAIIRAIDAKQPDAAPLITCASGMCKELKACGVWKQKTLPIRIPTYVQALIEVYQVTREVNPPIVEAKTATATPSPKSKSSPNSKVPPTEVSPFACAQRRALSLARSL